MADETKDSEVNITNKRNDDQKLMKILSSNAVYYIVFFAIIGLPIWYLTTTTYRAALPYEDVDQKFIEMQEAMFKINLQITFLTENAELNRLNDVNKRFNELLKEDEMYFEISSSLLKATKKELEAIDNSKSIEELDAKLHESSLNTLRIFVLDDKQAAKFQLSNQERILLHNLYLVESSLTDLKKLSAFVKDEFLNINNLGQIYMDELDNNRELANRNQKTEKVVANFDTDYEITFSLINDKPELVRDWDIDSSIEKYFKRLLKPLSSYVNFTIKAQTLLYSDLNSYKFQQKEKIFYVRSSDLSIMTNHLENRLGSRISDSSAFEFVTYVPSKQPLVISSENSQSLDSKTNAFLVPRWGGIYIHNLDKNSSQSIRTDESIKIFMTHFLDLIGIRLNKNSRKITRSGIFKSEIYVYLMEKTLKNQLNTMNTLKSLSLLLNKISSMVIEDHIAENFKLACESLDKSLKMLKDGNLEQAFEFSKLAYTNSEIVFFDKSLLEKLYFPEDQRFAIYIPLFIPVGIPLLLSVKYIRNWLKSSTK